MQPSNNAQPSAPTIEAWLLHEQEQLVAVQEKLRPLRAEEASIQDRIARLKDLLSAYSTTERPVSGSFARSTTITPIASLGESTSARVRRQVAELLDSSAEPMHINDIWQAFRTNGWEIPGRGIAANITAHLSGATQFVSPTRGYYRLATEADVATPKKTARKPTRRRTVKRGRTRGKQ